jgi:hypothetical protein
MGNDEAYAENLTVSAPKILWRLAEDAGAQENRDRSNTVQIALIEWLEKHYPEHYRKFKKAVG